MASLDEILRDKPYMNYPMLVGRIVLDAERISERYQIRIRDYFAAHPPLEKAWVRQLQELRYGKRGHAQDLAFPKWSDFILHIEEVFAEEIAGRSVAGDIGEDA